MTFEEDYIKFSEKGLKAGYELSKEAVKLGFAITKGTFKLLASLLKFILNHNDDPRADAIRSLNKGGVTTLKKLLKSGEEPVNLNVPAELRDYIANNAKAYGVSVFFLPNGKDYNMMCIPSQLNRVKALVQAAQSHAMINSLADKEYEKEDIYSAVYGHPSGKEYADNFYNGKSEEKDNFVPSGANSSEWENFYNERFGPDDAFNSKKNGYDIFCSKVTETMNKEYGNEANSFHAVIPNRGLYVLDNKNSTLIFYNINGTKSEKTIKADDIGSVKLWLDSVNKKEHIIQNRIERMYSNYSKKQKEVIADIFRGEYTVNGFNDLMSKYRDKDFTSRIIDKNYSPSKMTALYEAMAKFDKLYSPDKTAEMMNAIMADKHLSSESVMLISENIEKFDNINSVLLKGFTEKDISNIIASIDKVELANKTMIDEISKLRTSEMTYADIAVGISDSEHFIINGKEINMDQKAEFSDEFINQVKVLEFGKSMKINNLNISKSELGVYTVTDDQGKEIFRGKVRQLREGLSGISLKEMINSKDVQITEADGITTLKLNNFQMKVSTVIYEAVKQNPASSSVRELAEKVFMQDIDKKLDELKKAEYEKDIPFNGGTITKEIDDSYTLAVGGRFREFKNFDELSKYIHNDSKFEFDKIENAKNGSSIELFGLQIEKKDNNKYTIISQNKVKDVTYAELMELMDVAKKMQINNILSASSRNNIDIDIDEKINDLLNSENREEYLAKIEELFDTYEQENSEQGNSEQPENNSVNKGIENQTQATRQYCQESDLDNSFKDMGKDEILEYINNKNMDGESYKKLLSMIGAQQDLEGNSLKYSLNNIKLLAAQCPDLKLNDLKMKTGNEKDAAVIKLIAPVYYGKDGKEAADDIINNLEQSDSMNIGIYRFSKDPNGGYRIEAAKKEGSFADIQKNLSPGQLEAWCNKVQIGRKQVSFKIEEYVALKHEAELYSGKDKDEIIENVQKALENKRDQLLKKYSPDQVQNILDSAEYATLSGFNIAIPEYLQNKIKNMNFKDVESGDSLKEIRDTTLDVSVNIHSKFNSNVQSQSFSHNKHNKSEHEQER